MTVPRSLCALAGVMAAFGGALWLSAIAPLAAVIAASWSAVTIVHALAMVATTAVVLLVTTASALLAADWRADVQSREVWAQVNFAAARLSLPAIPVPRDDLDPRYLLGVDKEELRRVFQAHRFAPGAPLFDSTERGSLNAAAASQVDLTGQAARTARAVVRTIPAAATRVAGCRREAAVSGLGAARARLVVNANAWRGWPGAECMMSPTGQRQPADIIVLGSRRDDQSRPFPEAAAGSDTASSTEPPSCRGPPLDEARRSSGKTAIAAAKRSSRGEGPAAHALAGGDAVVGDNLGQPVPVCAAELSVIETYLGHVLDELLASPAAGSRPEQA